MSFFPFFCEHVTYIHVIHGQLCAFFQFKNDGIAYIYKQGIFKRFCLGSTRILHTSATFYEQGYNTYNTYVYLKSDGFFEGREHLFGEIIRTLGRSI